MWRELTYSNPGLNTNARIVKGLIYTCPICRQPFEQKSRMKRHYEGIRKYPLEIEITDF